MSETAPPDEPVDIQAWLSRAAPIWTRLLPQTMGNMGWRGYIRDSLKDDPSGIAGVLMLQATLEEHLTQRRVTAGEMIEPSEEMQAWIDDMKAARALLQEPGIAAAAADFRHRALTGVAAYGAVSKDIKEVLSDAFNLSYLASTARAGGRRLKARWFSKGKSGGGAPQYHKHIYESVSHGDLVSALAQTPRDGIHLCLIRDPEEPLYSYFVFGVKDGTNVFTLSEENSWAHPLASQMSRKPFRHLEERAEKFSFPYELLEPANGAATTDLAEGQRGADEIIGPRLALADVNPYSRVWLAMVMECIAADFWGKPGTAALSYCGDRIGYNALKAPVGLPVPRYATMVPAPRIAAVTRSEVTGKPVDRLWPGRTTFNQWMEERYADKVSESCLYLPAGSALSLPAPERADTRLDQGRDRYKLVENELRLGVHGETGTPTRVASDFFGKADRQELLHLDPRKVGTLKELKRDARWRARYNLAVGVDTLAEVEYRTRKAQIKEWFQASVQANHASLVEAAVRGILMVPSQVDGIGFGPPLTASRNIVSRHFKPGKWFSGGAFEVVLSQRIDADCCFFTGAQTSVWISFTPSLPAGIAALAGVKEADLPDVLRYWKCEDEYRGNHLLNDLDPMEWVPTNPWQKLRFSVLLCLSKGAFKAQCTAHGVAFAGDWEGVSKVPSGPDCSTSDQSCATASPELSGD